MYPVWGDTNGEEDRPSFSAIHELALLHIDVPPDGVASAVGAPGDPVGAVAELTRVSMGAFGAVSTGTAATARVVFGDDAGLFTLDRRVGAALTAALAGAGLATGAVFTATGAGSDDVSTETVVLRGALTRSLTVLHAPLIASRAGALVAITIAPIAMSAAKAPVRRMRRSRTMGACVAGEVLAELRERPASASANSVTVE